MFFALSEAENGGEKVQEAVPQTGPARFVSKKLSLSVALPLPFPYDRRNLKFCFRCNGKRLVGESLRVCMRQGIHTLLLCVFSQQHSGSHRRHGDSAAAIEITHSSHVRFSFASLFRAGLLLVYRYCDLNSRSFGPFGRRQFGRGRTLSTRVRGSGTWPASMNFDREKRMPKVIRTRVGTWMKRDKRAKGKSIRTYL